MIDKKLEQEFFDSLEENLSKADIAFRAYERGKNDALSVIKNIKSEIEQMDFDFGDYYDYTDTIIEMVSRVIDKNIAELKGENNG